MRDPRMIQRSAIGIGVAAIIAALCLAAVAADSSRTEKIPAAIDAAQYADFMGSEAFDLVDLAEGAEIQRRMFNRMTPSGFSWLQPMFPSVVPFDAAGFEESFLADLLGEDRNSVAVYPLSLALDPKTRETLVYNADGKLIATLPADGISRTWPEDADPARVTLQLDLLPSEDVEPYLYVENRITESIASGVAKAAKTGGVTLKGLGAGEFGFSADWSLTNGTIRLTVTNGADAAEIYSYTVLHTSTVVVTTWTNDEDEVITETNTLWTPVSPSFDGIESGWECQTTNLILTNGVGVWEDANISSNPCMRFYAAAQQVDTDADGLTDGSEILLHRTDPGMADTDRDGWSDSEELAEETDPLDRFSATRLARGVVINALCYNPSNSPASSNQWVQLHSTAASVVDLSDFRLQVAGSNYATRFTFPSNTWIQPGHFILLGGSDVTNGDSHAELGLPNSFPTNPTAGVRLVGPDGVAADPVDVVMYGTHAPFNEGNLPTNGWSSTNTDLWAGTGYQLVREMFGLDTDMRGDWQYDQVGELWNHSTVLDSDGDGLTDEEEYSGSAANGVPSDPLDPDTDDDGLQDGFEADHDLNPANPDTNGNAVPDADEINPDTGNTYLDDQLGTDVSVSVEAFLPGWILGQSIGSNGWVHFTLEDWDGVGVWATINEGGFVPEAFTYSVENAVVAFTTNIYHGGFRTVQLLLISTNHEVPIEVNVNDGGTYWTNQIPINYGPDIFAHFDVIKVDLDVGDGSGGGPDGDIDDPEDGTYGYIPGNRGNTNILSWSAGTLSPQPLKIVALAPGISSVGFKLVSYTTLDGFCANTHTPDAMSYDYSFDSSADSLLVSEPVVGGKAIVDFYCKDFGGKCRAEVTLRDAADNVLHAYWLYIPRDADNDGISDQWEENEVNEWNSQYDESQIIGNGFFAASDDTEKTDPDGSGFLAAHAAAGDSLTVMQEYRGFMFDGPSDWGGTAGYKRLSPARKNLLIEVENMGGFTGFATKAEVVSAMATVKAVFLNSAGAQVDYATDNCNAPYANFNSSNVVTTYRAGHRGHDSGIFDYSEYLYLLFCEKDWAVNVYGRGGDGWLGGNVYCVMDRARASSLSPLGVTFDYCIGHTATHELGHCLRAKDHQQYVEALQVNYSTLATNECVMIRRDDNDLKFDTAPGTSTVYTISLLDSASDTFTELDGQIDSITNYSAGVLGASGGAYSYTIKDVSWWVWPTADAIIRCYYDHSVMESPALILNQLLSPAFANTGTGYVYEVQRMDFNNKE